MLVRFYIRDDSGIKTEEWGLEAVPRISEFVYIENVGHGKVTAVWWTITTSPAVEVFLNSTEVDVLTRASDARSG